eukprot:1724175-Rhodomonas_salina.1
MHMLTHIHIAYTQYPHVRQTYPGTPLLRKSQTSSEVTDLLLSHRPPLKSQTSSEVTDPLPSHRPPPKSQTPS